MGRFQSGDPLGGDITGPQTLNRYSYVRNNPVNLIDPSGLDETCVIGCGGICDYDPWQCVIWGGPTYGYECDTCIYGLPPSPPPPPPDPTGAALGTMLDETQVMHAI